MPYSSGQTPRTVELFHLFNLSKDKYVDTLHEKIKKQLDYYMSIRKKLKASSDQKAEILEKVKRSYRDFKDKISVTKDTIP